MKLRKILVVEDNDINRELLCAILKDEYEVHEALNGQEALHFLQQNGNDISAVLLDLMMPEKDGYEVLKTMRQQEPTAQIPVIIMTSNNDEKSEIKALSLGANDFVSKPYNPSIVKHRLFNTIRFHENAALVNAIKIDALTGIYSRSAFFEKTAEMIKEKAAGYYVMSCFDINKFKLINDRYGNETGDRVLKHIGNVFQDGFTKIDGICGRVSDDCFAVLYPKAEMDSDELNQICQRAIYFDDTIVLNFSVGRYLVDDLTLSPSAMYDRADMAKALVKGRFDRDIVTFDESMLREMQREQMMSSEMKTALLTKQFEVWFQPQFNHASEALIGAEALVRWRHPTWGMISPGEFIPVFEQNGLIYELDKYVWEQACLLIRHWMDGGEQPIPISVNLSRCDILRADLFDVITGLINKYEIPTDYLRLEITESAFAKSGIVDVVSKLVSYGFIMEIDDFGSGYSSLNTLKDVPSQVVKLDMKFLEGEENSERGGNIIESVVRMTKWLGMTVLAEGVETASQADFLKSIGCKYVQGYLYARPMPMAEFEEFVRRLHCEEHLSVLEKVETLDQGAFWNPQSLDTLIFNAYVGGACVVEFARDNFEILRMNDKCMSEIFREYTNRQPEDRFSWIQFMEQESDTEFRRKVMAAIETKQEQTCEIILCFGVEEQDKTYLTIVMRLLASTGDRFLLYCLVSNNSAQHRAEEKEQLAYEELRLATRRQLEETARRFTDVVKDTPGGLARLCVTKNGKIYVEYINEELMELCGVSADILSDEKAPDVMEFVHPDDADRVKQLIAEMFETGEERNSVYRIRIKGGQYAWLNVYGKISESTDGTMYINAHYSLLTPQERQEISFKETVPFVLQAVLKFSNDLTFAKDSNFTYLCCTRAFANMVGLENEEDIVGKTDYDLFERELADKYRSEDIRLMESGEAIVDIEERIPSAEGRNHYAIASKYLLYDTSGTIVGIYGTGRDITEDRITYEQLRVLTDSIPGGIATFESSPECLRILYSNEGFYRFSGYSKDEYEQLCAQDPLYMVYEQDRHVIYEGIADLREHPEESADCVFRCHTKDGNFRWIHLRGSVTDISSDTMIITMVQFDITDQMVAEESRRIHEEEIKVAMSQMGKMICEYDPTTGTLIMPEAYADMYGVSVVKENMPYNYEVDDILDPGYYETYVKFYESIKQGQPTGEADVHIKRKDGTWRWEHYEFVTFFSDDNKPIKAIISVEDMTEHEEILQRYQHEQQLHHELIKDSIIYYEVNLTSGLIVEYLSQYNDVEGMHTGQQSNDKIRDEILKNILENDWENVQKTLSLEALRKANRQGKHNIVTEYRRKLQDNSVLWVQANVTIMKNPGDTDVIAFVFVKDIDAEKKNYLAFESVVASEIESVALINIKSGMSRLVKELNHPGEARVNVKIPYDNYCKGLIKKNVVKEDLEACLHFFTVESHVKMLEKQSSATITYAIYKKDGTKRWMRAVIHYLDRTQEDIVLSRCDVTDIYLEEQRQKLALQKAVRDANEANHAKSDFLSRMSHDMRTPMNAIIGMVFLALEETNPEQIQKYLKNIDSSSHFLLGLINDVLDLSRIESGKIELHKESFRADEFERDINTVIQPLMEHKKLDFVLRLQANDTAILVDKLRFKQIFFNLLSNAAKYTKEGGRVEFIEETLPEKNGKYGMRFIIRDNGIGMSKEFQEVLFTPFAQERHNDERQEIQGTGLGLAIVKNLVDAMEGNISVKSEIGEGSEFTVDLYAYKVDDKNRPKEEEKIDYSCLAGIRVLLAEDNEINVYVAEGLMNRIGGTIEVASNGQEAVWMYEHAEEGYYNLILMYIRMPVMNGLEATRKIRSLEQGQNRHIPIIAMTADAFIDDRNKTLDAGMDAHIAKPIEPKVLYKTLVRIVQEEME